MAVLALGAVRQRTHRDALIALSRVCTCRPPGAPRPVDVAGALTSTAAMAALVYGFIRAAVGLGDRLTLASFAVAVLLLALFVASRPVRRSRSCRCACSPTATAPAST